MAKNFNYIHWVPEGWKFSITSSKPNQEALDRYILDFLHHKNEMVLKLASAAPIAICSETQPIKNAPIVSFWKLKTLSGQPVLAALTECNNLIVLPNKKAFQGLW